MRYFAQHRAGLGELVADGLRRDLAGVRLVSADDSGLLFDSRSDEAAVSGLGYLKNAFSVLGTAPRSTPQKAAERFAEQVLSTPMLRGGRRATAFRTMVSVEGKLVGLPRPAKQRLESSIARVTGARVNARGGAGTEYWVIGRRELSSMLFCRRLTAGIRPGAAGSLGADLATLLVKASSPRPDDVFLDPFAGSGSLLRARLESPYRRLIAADLALAEGTLLPEVRRAARTTLLDEDARDLPSVPDGSVGAVVTDPPWGEYDDLDTDVATFTRDLFASLDRVLDPAHGRLVLLLSRRVAETAADHWQLSGLELRHTHQLLVNGHPATIQLGGRPDRKGRAAG